MDKAMHSEFEGHTPGPWEIDDFEGGVMYTHPTGLKFHVCLIGSGGSTTMTDEEEIANLHLIASAPDLLKENQSLRSELQKQKELNAELVEGLENIQIGLTAMNWARDLDEKDQKEKYVFDLLESLIKKSKES